MNTPVNRTVLYVLLATVVAVLAVGVNSVLYANYAANKAIAASNAGLAKSQQLWCKMLVGLDKYYTQVPPKTEEGKAFAAEVGTLVTKFKCQGN